MNLKDFLAAKEKPPELFWSLVIEKGWVQAGVWYIGKENAEVVSVSPGAAWETDEELIGATDAALSSVIQKLPEEYKEPEKTVFGVSSTWVKNGEIVEEYLARIKRICTELSLNPVGFVVLSEAIAHLYKSEEQAPVSAIILGLGSESLEISIFKLGSLVGTTSVSRSVSIIEDVTEGLSRFEGAMPLPSRFIIYNGKGGELEEAKEELMKASWDDIEKIKFLHTPKAEVLDSDKKVLATSLAGANEIGHVSQVVSQEEEETTPIPEEVQNVSEVKENVTAEDLGFAIGGDISEQAPKIEAPQVIPPAPVHIAKSKTPLFVLLGSLLIFIIGVILFAWFYPKAVVSIFVTPKKFEQETQMSFNVDGTDAKISTINVSGNKTKTTTGTKLIGDKATGSVQIANGNSSSITLAVGTILTSSGGLKFATTSQASISGQLLPGSPGTATVSVNSYDIGAQYNLAKGEIFSVGNYVKSLVAGTSVADFSGGSSQQIAAVSKDDQSGLETSLKTELSQNAKEQLLAQATNDQIFIDDLASLDVTSENFDHKIGDQADSLKLSLALAATGILADRPKLLEYAKGVLKDKIPQGFVLRDSQITFKFKFINKTDGKFNYNVTIAANFLPQVKVDDIVSKISGKTPSVVESYLSSIPGFSRAEVVLKPRLPGPFGTLPRISKNITVEVTAEQ